MTAILDELWFEQLGTDRVALRGVKGDVPPATTKVGITAKGGYQAEVHWFLCGLDIHDKARMMEAQARHGLRPYSDKFTKLDFTINGSVAEDASNQNAATVDFRIFVQAPKASDISPAKFFRPVVDPIMEGYPGATCHLDWRQAFPKAIQEYYVTLLPQADVQHKVHLWDGSEFEIPPPPQSKVYPSQQPSQSNAEGVKTSEWGQTTRGPLGWVVHARSGDKGSNANVGFWVRHRDEWDWLRSTLSVDTIKRLLADEYKGNKIVRSDCNVSRPGDDLLTLGQDRFELPNAYAVHFLLHDHLDRGVSCSSSYDFLGKHVAEYLRSKHVDLPTKFLNRGKL